MNGSIPKATTLKNTSLIVLYRCEIMQSTTIISLFNVDRDGVQLKIILWNNGPNLLEQDDVLKFEKECNKKGISFEIYQDVRNISLSHLYNFCINKNRDADFFTILDQDSTLSTDFLTNLVKYASYDLICPKIYDEKETNSQHYPHKINRGTTISEGEFNVKEITSIGSGLSLSNNLISTMLKSDNYIFDEDYVFYFIDLEFFGRLREIDSISGYCCGTMLHSESTKLDYSQMSESTKLEIGYFNVIRRIKKQRNKAQLIYFCVRHKLKTGCSFESFKKILKCAFITKQHPRVIFKIPNNFEPDNSYAQVDESIIKE